jgi:hypothetical protein
MTPEPGIYNHNWGSAQHDIATSIHRPLYATAISLRTSAEEPPCILASIDYCWFQSYELLQSLRLPVLARLGIEEQRFLLLLTHSHAVPHIDPELESCPGGDKIPAYRAKLIHALNTAIDEAIASEEPAILSWGSGTATLARTRDFRDEHTGRVLCGPNPGGTPDNTLIVGRVTAESSGKVLATLVNYACHPVSLGGGNRTVSPDYIGAMRELLEEHTDGAPCLFLHGPSGNQTPRDSYSDDPAVADRNGAILGFAALSVLTALLPPGKRSEFTHIEKSGTDLAVWENRPYGVDQVLRACVERVQLPAGRTAPSVAEIDAQLHSQTDPAERVRLTRSKQFQANIEAGLGAGFPIWGMRFGRSVLIGTPAEPFAQLQGQLRARFPELAVVVANHANGSFNYLPPREYFGNGAYEQDCTDYGPGALEAVIESASRMIERLSAD